jgi:hypothetical protein
MRTPLILLHGVVFWFFIGRGRRWFSAIPFLGMVILGVWRYRRQQQASVDMRVDMQRILESYGVAIAWSILVIGIWQLIQIFGLLTYTTWFRLLGGHMLVYLAALFLGKKDLAVIAHVGRRVSGALIVLQARQFGNRWLVMDMISMMISLSLALYACIVFVLGAMGSKIDRRIHALLFIFLQLTILVGVIYYSDTITLWTLLGGQIYLGVLYGVLQRIYKERMLPTLDIPWDTEDLLHVILRGEQLHGQQIHKVGQAWSLREMIFQIGDEVIQKLPTWSFRVLWAINLVFMLIQLVLILTGKTGDVGLWIDIWFWVSTGVYIINYIVLQKQKIDVWWQRALTFFLINFGIYLTIYHLFGNVPVYLVGCGVLWSLFNAGAMIHFRSSPIGALLTQKDYQYWLFGNMVAIAANSYFMFLLPMSLQLRFTLVMIYLALQALLLKYQLAPMKKTYLRDEEA